MRWILAALLFAQASPPTPQLIPPFPQRTEAALYENIGLCYADLKDMERWSRALIAKMSELQKELDRLREARAREGEAPIKAEPKPPTPEAK